MTVATAVCALVVGQNEFVAVVVMVHRAMVVAVLAADFLHRMSVLQLVLGLVALWADATHTQKIHFKNKNFIDDNEYVFCCVYVLKYLVNRYFKVKLKSFQPK